MQNEETQGGVVMGAAEEDGISWEATASNTRDLARALVPLAVALLACVVALVFALPIGGRVALGPDFGESVEAVLHASALAGDDPPAADLMSQAADVVNKRLAAYGVVDGRASVRDDGLAVRLRQIGDVQRLADVSGRAGKFELVEVDRIADAEAIAKIRSAGSGAILAPGSYAALLTNADLGPVTADPSSDDEDETDYALTFEFTGEGRRAFAEVTSKLSQSGGLLAFVMDGVVFAVSSVPSAMLEGTVSITQGFSAQEATRIAAVLTGGELPVSLSDGGSSRVAPALGSSGLTVALSLVALAFVAALAYLAWSYRGYALVTLAAGLAWLCGSLAGVVVLGSADLLYFDLYAYFGLLVGLADVVVWAWRSLGRLSQNTRAGMPRERATAEAVRHTCDTRAVAVAVTGVLALLGIALGWPVSVAHLLTAGAVGLLAALASHLLVSIPLVKLVSYGPAAAQPGLWRVTRAEKRHDGPAPQPKAAKRTAKRRPAPAPKSAGASIKAAKARKAAARAQAGAEAKAASHE